MLVLNPPKATNPHVEKAQTFLQFCLKNVLENEPALLRISQFFVNDFVNLSLIL